MNFQKLLLFGILCFVFSHINAQKKNVYKEHRVLILLDASSSMVEPWSNNTTRFQAAAHLITRLMDSVYHMNPEVQFGLRVYGHQYGVPENNCYDTRSEVMFSRDNRIQMDLRLASLKPIGVSPIAYSLQVAAEQDFVLGKDYTYSLLLITDGAESCGGDICNVVQTILRKKIDFKPYIISMIDYAPLRDQYACLGTYFTASDSNGIAIAVDSISSYYRKTLQTRIKKDEPTPPPPAVATAPKNTPKPTPPAPAPQPSLPDTPKDTTPAQVAPVVQEPPRNTRIVVQDNLKPAKDTVRTIYTKTRTKHFPLFWSTPAPKPIPIPTPKPPVPDKTAVATTQPVSRPAVKNTPTPQQQQETSFVTTTENADKTLLAIYFTDGKGKYYQTSPPVKVLDSRTGQEVKKFYRTVGPNGDPDPQELPPGIYTLVVGRNGNLVTKNVQILAGQKNKVTIKSVKGTLSFAYDGNIDRPVTEFIAVVKKNFEPGPLVTQRCDTQMDYESGNYHIEINTLPVSRRTIDLDFASSYRIDIPEPGYVEFTNENDLGKVGLFYQLGDQFVQFYAIEINGNPEKQKLRLQPGKYQARYKKNPQIPVHNEEKHVFHIRSNQTTTLELP